MLPIKFGRGEGSRPKALKSILFHQSGIALTIFPSMGITNNDYSDPPFAGR
jgi:hypothetical protein